MNKLIKQIKSIPKSYFTLNDIKKISRLEENSLKVALSRLVKRGELIKLARGIYANDIAKVEWEKLAVELYPPCYISFESALANHNILSQKPYQLTLAAAKRSKTIEIGERTIVYHHLKKEMFWGFRNDQGILSAEPEKALLDLAYLSLNGYAKFDPEEINFGLIDKTKLLSYLKKIKNKKLEKIMKPAQLK